MQEKVEVEVELEAEVEDPHWGWRCVGGIISLPYCRPHYLVSIVTPAIHGNAIVYYSSLVY